MHYIKFTLFVTLFLIYLKSFSQTNLLNNSSFEYPDPSNYPNGVAQVEKLDFWKDDLNKVYKDCSDDYIDNKEDIYFHSPDWFKNSYQHHIMKEYPNCIPVDGHNGYGYVGMGNGELIEQNLSNPLINGQGYSLTAWIRPVKNTWGCMGTYGYYGTYPWTGAYLNVYIANSKITYQHNSACRYLCSGTHADEYDEFNNGIFQHIEYKGQKEIYTNSYPVGQWTKIVFNFEIPDDNRNYDWIAIELTDMNDYCEQYLLLDDVELYEGCTNGCSSTDGAININTTNYHTDTNPFTVSGLKNISVVEFMVYPYGGQYPIWSKTVNNPPDKLAWNGTVGNTGAEAAAAMYVYKILVTNDCVEDRELTGLFSKVNGSGAPTQDSPFFDYTGAVSKPPDPCCALQQDIYINNQTLIQDKTIFSDPPTNTINPPLLYKAIHNITAENVTIPANNEVLFQAGKQIDLPPDFGAEYGSEFTAEIVPCEEQSISKYLNVGFVNYNYIVGDTVQLYCFYENYIEPLEYYWDLGNGSTSRDRNPYTVYNDTGTYNIKLQIADAENNIDSISKLIEITQFAFNGTLAETEYCGENPVSGDTLVLMSDGVILPDSICTPAVTNMYGEFQFDSLQIASLNDTLLYSIVTKSGFPLDKMEYKSIDEWVHSSPLTLTLAKLNQQWAARYPGNDTIGGIATAMDLHDNIYVTGYLYQNRSPEADFVTIKYSPTGTQLWAVEYNTIDTSYSADKATTIAVDDSLNVYVAGSTLVNGGNYDWVIIKYDSSGNQVWLRTYNGQANNTDVVYAMKLDNIGNIYLTGKSYNSGSNCSFATIKYSSAGTKLWESRYAAPNSSDFNVPSALAIDANANVYVTGQSIYDNDSIIFSTVKYNSSGTQQWATNYRGDNCNFSYAHGIALDTTSNVYVSGGCVGIADTSGFQVFATTVKYNSNGVQQWANMYNSTNTNGDYAYSYAITTDEAGTSYIAGQTTSGSSSIDYLLIKYSSNGTEQWVRTNNGALDDEDKAYLIKHDAEGNVYMSGYSLCSLDSGNFNTYTTLKYTADGDKEWTAIYNGMGNGDNNPAALSVSANGNVYLAGSSSNNDVSDLAIVKYSQCPAEANNLKIITPQSPSNSEIPDQEVFVKIIPNPNNGNMQLAYKIPDNTRATFELYNIMGEKLLNYSIYGGKNTLDISATMLDNGIYFYQVIAGNKRIAADKIVVIK